VRSGSQHEKEIPFEVWCNLNPHLQNPIAGRKAPFWLQKERDPWNAWWTRSQPARRGRWEDPGAVLGSRDVESRSRRGTFCSDASSARCMLPPPSSTPPHKETHFWPVQPPPSRGGNLTAASGRYGVCWENYWPIHGEFSCWQFHLSSPQTNGTRGIHLSRKQQPKH